MSTFRKILYLWILASSVAAIANEIVPAEDILAGKILYENNCLQCHGENGISDVSSIPNLRGQKMAYMKYEFVSFLAATPERYSPPEMVTALRNIEKEGRKKVLLYLSSLPLANEPLEDIEHPGKALYENHCSACHKAGGITNPDSSSPFLRGQNKEYLATQLSNFENETRPSGIMLSGERITELREAGTLEPIIDYLSNLPIKRSSESE